MTGFELTLASSSDKMKAVNKSDPIAWEGPLPRHVGWRSNLNAVVGFNSLADVST